MNNKMQYGGTESVVLNYFKHVYSAEFQIDFMLHTSEEECRNNPICIALQEQGSHVYCVTPRKISIKKNIQDIRRVLAEGNYDIIHSHTDCVSGIILQIAKNMNVPVRIAHSHNTQSEVSGGYLKRKIHLFVLWIAKLNLRRVATHYIACSTEAGNWLFGKGIMRSRNVYILHNAISVERFLYDDSVRNRVRSELGYKQTELVIGHVGRFSYQKNHEYLIKLFYEAHKRNKQARLLLVGSGELEDVIKNMTKKLGIEDSVRFYGNSNRVNELLQAMDVFCFPSRFEGLSVALIEAQTAGLPCIVNDSVKISNESSITPLIKRIPLNCMNEWIDAIESSNTVARKNMKSYIEKAGYSLFTEAEKLKAFYRDSIS